MKNTVPLKLLKMRQCFNNYSENAISQVVEQAPGKIFMGLEGETIGVIKSAKLVDGTNNVVEFEMETE